MGRDREGAPWRAPTQLQARVPRHSEARRRGGLERTASLRPLVRQEEGDCLRALVPLAREEHDDWRDAGLSLQNALCDKFFIDVVLIFLKPKILYLCYIFYVF